jgi:hypothetical protein
MLNSENGRTAKGPIGPLSLALPVPHGNISEGDRWQIAGLFRDYLPSLPQESSFTVALNLKGGYAAVIHSAQLGDSQLEMTVGKAFQFEFTVIDQIRQQPADVTAWTKFWFMAKPNQNFPDTSAIFTKTMGAGITVQDAAGGLVLVQIAAADTSALGNVRTVLFAQIQGLDGSGSPFDLWEGALLLSPATIAASS